MKLNTEKHMNSHVGTKHMTKDEIHKNSQCKDGKCPDINKKVQTGNGINNDAEYQNRRHYAVKIVCG
jgi:hypothetical protein